MCDLVAYEYGNQASMTGVPILAAPGAIVEIAGFVWETLNQMKRVLVVEDELSMRETLKCLMVRWQYEVTLSESVREAQHCMLSKPPFDIVVSDYLLPDGDGKEFYFWLRRECAYEVPFLMLSGNYAHQQDDTFEFLAKPFNIHHLRSVMDRMCGKAQKRMAAG